MITTVQKLYTVKGAILVDMSKSRAWCLAMIPLFQMQLHVDINTQVVSTTAVIVLVPYSLP